MRPLPHDQALRHRYWLLLGLITVCSLLVLKSRYQLTLVVGNSMQPTLGPGDLLVIDKNAYRRTEPARGDLVVAHYRSELVVKRVVALPGEEVQLRNGLLYINGVPRPENHLIEPGPLDIDKGTLMSGRFATLGDNRNVPREQAIHPILSKENIIGKVVASVGL